MSEADITAATTLGPGHSRGGIPLKIHLGEQEYSALVHVARRRHTTASELVEELVLHALEHADVPPAAESSVKRPHTTYEAATHGYRPD
ncbi:hypothetical protein [Leifsonia sp. SIMBA_070]|uniref:hypothetical protein n=1 Tax=Leifsonia sp. SIMBA_070 TaxID=3085810 RepID=UPI0039794185